MRGKNKIILSGTTQLMVSDSRIIQFDSGRRKRVFIPKDKDGYLTRLDLKLKDHLIKNGRGKYERQ